eukprot:g6584.t1
MATAKTAAIATSAAVPAAPDLESAAPASAAPRKTCLNGDVFSTIVVSAEIIRKLSSTHDEPQLSDDAVVAIQRTMHAWLMRYLKILAPILSREGDWAFAEDDEEEQGPQCCVITEELMTIALKAALCNPSGTALFRHARSEGNKATYLAAARASSHLSAFGTLQGIEDGGIKV